MDYVLEVCEMRRQDSDFINLCMGTSRFQTNSLVDLSLSEKDLEDSLLYGDFKGMEELREGLSNLYKR